MFQNPLHAHATGIKGKNNPVDWRFSYLRHTSRVAQDRISNPLKSINSLRTCSSHHAALFAHLDWLPICVDVRGFTVCLLICSAIPSIQTLLLSFMALCWLGWVLSFFPPFLGPFLLFWDQMARGTEAPLLSGRLCEKRLSSLM